MNAFRNDIKITPMKGEDDGWLLINMANKNYVPIIDLNPEYFKQQDKPIKFVIRKNQQGPDRYE